MATTSPATSRRERAQLADLFDEVGPDAPTLCGDWMTRDLAAHLVVREHRPVAAAGIVIPQLSGYTDKVQQATSAREWQDLVDTVRNGPPIWSPTRLEPVDKAINTIEFFVHHEDVRRAGEQWEPRDLDRRTNDELRTAIARAARMLTRSLGPGLVLQPDDTTDPSPITARTGEPVVTVTGPIGEIILYLYGRKDVAQVELHGDDETVEAVNQHEFGF